jgi:NO-binding membrane sensor protein with MHYT domain
MYEADRGSEEEKAGMSYSLLASGPGLFHPILRSSTALWVSSESQASVSCLFVGIGIGSGICVVRQIVDSR